MRKRAAPTSLFFVRDICTHDPREKELKDNIKLFLCECHAVCNLFIMSREKKFLFYSLLLCREFQIVGVTRKENIKWSEKQIFVSECDDDKLGSFLML